VPGAVFVVEASVAPVVPEDDPSAAPAGGILSPEQVIAPNTNTEGAKRRTIWGIRIATGV